MDLIELTKGNLVPMDDIRAALGRENSVSKVADLTKKLELIRQADKANDDRRHYWTEAAIWSLRRLGRLIKEGQRKGTIAKRGAGHHIDKSKTATLADLEIDEHWSRRAQLADTLSDQEAVDLISKFREKDTLTKGKWLGEIARQERRKKRDPAVVDSVDFKITRSQRVIPCDAVITDPPYGILDEPWEPDELERFTRDWLTRWNKCGAHFFAVFFSQQYLFEGAVWFDESLPSYTFQQLLVWHYRNITSKHKSRQGFKQSWEPVLFYRRTDSDKEVQLDGGSWGESLNDFDCHVAAVPQSNFNDAEEKVHPAQKPVSVMSWLVNALSNQGELVVDPFAGSGTTGIAAVRYGRRFHGIETDAEFRRLAEERISSYATV